MLTFSVNCVVTPEKAEKIAKLVSEINEYNRDSAGIAYLNIVENRGKNKECGHTSLNSLQARREFNMYADNAKKQDKVVEVDDEVNVRNFSSSLSYNIEESVIRTNDTENIVKEFLKWREKIFLKRGYDIYRLIELALLEDKQAYIKIYTIFKDFKILDLLTDVFLNKKVIPKLKEILD